MNAAELLEQAYDNLRGLVAGTVDGLSPEVLADRLDGASNSIGWLVWHLSRVQDDHVAEVAGREQVWTSDGWSGRFGLPFGDDTIGYGQSTDEVGQVQTTADLLVGYHDAVHAATVAYLRGLSDADLDRVVDERWDPPVTLGVRLLSVLGDDLQHIGQAAYAKGLIDRR